MNKVMTFSEKVVNLVSIKIESMKNILTVLFAIFAVNLIYAQQICDFDGYLSRHSALIENAETKIREGLGSERGGASVKIIPVVVHVIHLGGTENISDAQIQSQIDVLNEDYRKIAGTNGDGAGVDTEIEFRLAKKNPDGKCSNGIVRINSSLSNHQTHQRSALKDLSFWDNLRYLNIYVVRTINGSTLGYSSFPGGPADEDGIVVRHNYFGRIGTAASSLGRTTTHEVGHWLGLYHTFNGGCGTDVCNDGDYVCDTPPAAAPNFGCPTTANTCSNDSPDVLDQIANYMDYSDDNCKSMLSQGQKDRAQSSLNTLRFDIWQPWNIDSTGTDSNYVSPTCNVIADFTSNNQDICINNSVQYINKSLNDPISYQWWFPGGTPNSSTLANPVISYSAIGSYDVILKVTGANGTDSIFLPSYMNVTTPPIGQSLPYFEDFESLTWPPVDMTIDNPDGGITWELDTIAKAYAGNASAKINNLINTNYGQSDAMILPSFNLSTFTGIPYISFMWAYAKSDPSYSDELIVLVSTDCGVNFNQILYKTGNTMTTGPTQTTPYIPDSTTIWKLANVSLGAYATQTNVILKIINVTDGGNNLYIDHIQVNGSVVGMEDNEIFENSISIFPNPASDYLQINSSGEKINSVEIYSVSGQQVKMIDVENADSTVLISFDEELKTGFYQVIIGVGNYKVFKKLIVE